MRKDYVLLNLNDDSLPFLQPKKSVWRSWNQLSRLQRNLIMMLSVTFILCIIYFVASHHLYKDISFRDDSADNILIPDRKVFPTEIDASQAPQMNSGVIENAHLKRPNVLRPPALVREEPEEGKDQLAPPQQVFDSGDNAIEPAAHPGPVKFTGATNDKQRAVQEAFRHAWKGYRQFAWGHDHLKPISKTYHDWFGLGLTIVDSLDTMYIMGLKEEFSEARDWVNKGLDLNKFIDVNLFEVTIRVLGGLLAAYHLSGDQLFLDKGLDLGNRLLPCFTKSPSAIPYSDVNLLSHMAHSPMWGPDSSTTSEVTTIQLEFRDLARTTKVAKFEELASKVSEHVHGLQKKDGLVPVFLNPRTGNFQTHSDIKLGARGDSYYEYLVKQWIQTGRTIDYFKEDYLQAVEGIQKHLVRRTPKNNWVYVGELQGSRDFVPKMDHLACYLPGTLALGYLHGLPSSHLELAQDLIVTCYATYTDRPTSLAPEISYFRLNNEEGLGDIMVKDNDAHNLLRPEFVESLWYLYQITGNTTYQDWGWNVFQAFEKYTKVANGYTSISNVNKPEDVKPKDMMESFFLGETLKYFYLLFSDDRQLIDLKKYVVNTEAHPLPIYSS